MTSVQIDIRDGLSSSVAIKGPCRVATTANITLVGEQTIDGVAVVTDDRVLVKNQTTASDNGIYVADTGNWRRSKDFNKTRDVKTGTLVNVTNGTVGAGVWELTTADPISVGSTNLVFAQTVTKAYVDQRSMGVNILAFGCKPDNGVTDNLAPFLAAAAFAIAGGFALYAPSGGAYHFSAKVDIPALTAGQQLTINGAGGEATVFHWPNADGGLQTTLSSSGWWMRNPNGNPVRVAGVAFSTGQDGGGTALKVIANGLEGRPSPALIWDDLVFRGASSGYCWTTGLYMSKASYNHGSNLRWFGKISGTTGTFLKISSEADNTADPVGHFFVNCDGVYGNKWIDAGDDVEGIHLANCDGTAFNYGVDWEASLTGGESQLAMSNCQWSVNTTAVKLQGIYHSHIVGNLIFSAGDGILITRGGYNTIASNVISGKPGNNAISIQTGGSWHPSWKHTIVGNDLREFTNGIVAGTGVTGVKAGLNTYYNVTNEIVDVDGTNDFMDRVQLIGTDLTPKVADGVALGTAALPFSDVFLATGGVVDMNNGNVKLIHQAGALLYQIAGVNSHAFTSNLMRPTTNDSIAIGAASLAYSDAFFATGAVIGFGNGDYAITHSTGKMTFNGAVLSSHATQGIGYATGAGGTVTQATSKATAVTLSKASGAITMNAAALAAGTIVSFVLTNTAIAATDVLILNHISGGTVGSYSLNAQCAAGSATINVRNNTAGSLSEAIVIQYAVVKAVNA